MVCQILAVNLTHLNHKKIRITVDSKTHFIHAITIFYLSQTFARIFSILITYNYFIFELNLIKYFILSYIYIINIRILIQEFKIKVFY